MNKLRDSFITLVLFALLILLMMALLDNGDVEERENGAGSYYESEEIEELPSNEPEEKPKQEIADNENMALKENEIIVLPLTPDGKYVFLTFDDGPTANTRAILEILADHDIPATFFFEGRRLQQKENVATLLTDILQKGHYIGLHSMSHNAYFLYQTTLAAANFYNEMRENQQLLYELTGGWKTNLVRPPYGSFPNFTAEHFNIIDASDFNVWDWNVDTNDWRYRFYGGVDAIMASVELSMEIHHQPNHVVVLFHEYDITVTALPNVIDFFKSQNFTFLAYHPYLHFPLYLNNAIKRPQ